MLFAVPDWTVAEWSAAIEAGGAVVGALATVVVAAIVHNWGVLHARQTVTQEINLALRTYNLAALTQPELMTVITGAHPGTVDEMRQLFHVHYRLSVLRDIFEARRNKILPEAFSQYGFDEWIFGLCRTYRSALERALSDPRSHSQDFVAHVRKRIAAFDQAAAAAKEGQPSAVALAGST